MKILKLLMLSTLFLGAGDFDLAVKDYEKGAYIKALNTFYMLAKKDDAKAQYNVGLIYAKGQGVKQDLVQAQEWYEKAALQGNALAQYNLAQLFQASGKDDIHGYEKAKHWYEKAIKNKVKEAYNNLASLYALGLGVKKDQKKALSLFAKGAKLEDPAATLNLAVLYAWGEEVNNDKMKAYEYFKKALKAGKSEASGYLDTLCKESAWVCKE